MIMCQSGLGSVYSRRSGFESQSDPDNKNMTSDAVEPITFPPNFLQSFVLFEVMI